LLRSRRKHVIRRGFTLRPLWRPWLKTPLKRRRRRSRRFFAGLFGAKRWRRERRGKFVLRRLKSTFDKSVYILRIAQNTATTLNRRGLRRRYTVLAALLAQRPRQFLAVRSAMPLRSKLRRLVRQKKSMSLTSHDTTYRIHGNVRKLPVARAVVNAIPSRRIAKPQKLFTSSKYLL